MLLVYGATGKAGKLVVRRALAEGWKVAAFVRNEGRVEEAVRPQITIVKGDLCDAAAVTDAVRSVRPDAIVDASSALPFGHARGQKPNDADRTVFIQATVAALQADGRLSECVLVIVGGQLIREPGGTIDSWPVAALAWVLRNVVARAQVAREEGMLRWCFDEPGLRFVVARMGQMLETPPRGTLVPEPTANNIQRGSASYGDVADALVRLAGDGERTWERKAVYFNYA